MKCTLAAEYHFDRECIGKVCNFWADCGAKRPKEKIIEKSLDKGKRLS